MKGAKEAKISYFAAHLTTIVSVSLVLVIVGIIALISICAASGSRQLKEQVELSAILSDSMTNEQGFELLAYIQNKVYSKESHLFTKEDALRIWEEETGENLEDVFGVNPLSPEVSFTLKATYTHPDSIKKISEELSALDEVEAVSVPDASMIEAMNANIDGLRIVLGVIALALIIISFVLINNTVHLTIYSRRFTIHTMQLVGATNGFIRRPFVLNNMFAGLLSGVIAVGLLTGAVAYIESCELPLFDKFIGIDEYVLVAGGLLLFGALICAVAAIIATGVYLKKEFDDLFK